MELFDLAFLGKPVWMWGTFLSIVVLLLMFDLGVLNRKDEEISVKQSIKLSLFYVTIGLLFGLLVWNEMGVNAAQEYYTGFIIEKTLSLDNIFVISLVFSYFHIPRIYQHRVLFWGILGVVILRGVMIVVGAELIHRFEWILYIFAAFLIFTGIKLFKSADEEPNIADNVVLRTAIKYLRATPKLHGHKFFVREENASGKSVLSATPLFISLVVIEFVDVIFAVDSVPAIFAITTDQYVVYTSNVFAILGLRALYFALAAMLHRFHYLNYALSVVLIFIGGKVFYPLISDGDKIPPGISLVVTIAILGAGIAYSLVKTKDAK